MGLLKKRLGESPVPGSATVSLPAGTVTINYEEARMGRGVGDDTSKRWPGIPGDLEVTIRPAMGREFLLIDRPRGNHEYSTLKQVGTRYGRVEIPVAGDYAVTVVHFTTDRELFEPHLMFKG